MKDLLSSAQWAYIPPSTAF